MKQYQELLQRILDENAAEIIRDDRTGTGTISVFGDQRRYNLKEGFPAVTTKKLAWKSVVSELLWFLEGSTNERRLAELRYGKSPRELTDKPTIWSNDASEYIKRNHLHSTDTFVPVGLGYGAQWRTSGVEIGWGKFDQIRNVIHSIKNNPYSRRHIVSAWNPYQLSEDMTALPPCHVLFQFYVKNGKLSCQLYQRSADCCLGIPFNIASYALLTHIIARETGYDVGDFIHTIGDAHIYSNHIENTKVQLKREPYPLPTLEIDESFDLERVLLGLSRLDEVDNFRLTNYQHHDKLEFEMSF